MKNTFLLVLSMFVFSMLQAQYTVSGIILDSNQKSIEFASISIFPTTDSTALTGLISDSKGAFTISDLDAGTYVLAVQMLGYEDWTKAINLNKNIDLSNIILKEEQVLLNEVEVVARQSVLENHLGKKVLRIGQDLTSTGSNVLEALEIVPSVTTTPRGQLQIRGNSNVIIYINGKETRRTSETLKYISAEALDKIEIITNPSAQYDAEGVGGIINLVYKKDKMAAFKLQTISNLTIMTNPLDFNPELGINASLNKDKWFFFTNLSYEYGAYEDYFDSKRVNYQDSLQRYENLNIFQGLGNIANLNLGLTIEPDSSFSMGLEANYDQWDFQNEIIQNNIFDYRYTDNKEVLVNNRRRELENELWVNFSLEKALKKEQILKLSLTTGGENESNFTQSDDIDLSTFPDIVQSFIQSSDESESQRYYQGKLDYERPFFNWGTLETGTQAAFIRYHILQKILLRSSSLVLPYNDFNMDMQKLAIYALQKNQINRFEYALGFRLEQFDSRALQVTDQEEFIQKYLRLFPSAQINILLPDQAHTLGFNYTRRIKRPRFHELNPYISYEDPLNLETGNPALRPEIANLLEINYHREIKQFNMDLSLYQRMTNDAIQSIIQPIDNNQTLTTKVNIGKEVSQGIEVQLEYRFNKIFKTMATFVWAQSQFSDEENEITYNNRATWNVQFRQQLQLKNNWKIELVEIYRAPGYQIQESSNAVYYMNLGIRKKINNKRGSISLSIRDIFNTRIDVETFSTTDFEIERTYKWQTRQIRLGLQYNIFNN